MNTGRMIRVNYNNEFSKEFPSGTSLEIISKSFQNYYSFPILISRVNNDIVELSETVTKKCSVNFYDRSDSLGNGVYGRTLQFIVIVAVKRVLGSSVSINIEHSIDKGFFCTVSADLNKKIVKEIEKTMKEISKENLVIQKISVVRSDAIRYFKKEKQMDKVNALKYISNTYVNLYNLDSIYDYFYGKLSN